MRFLLVGLILCNTTEDLVNEFCERSVENRDNTLYFKSHCTVRKLHFSFILEFKCTKEGIHVNKSSYTLPLALKGFLSSCNCVC